MPAHSSSARLDGTEELQSRPMKPLFGGQFGKVSLKQAGLHSSAKVTADGRIDVAVQDGSKELSNLLATALRRTFDKRQADQTAKLSLKSQVRPEFPIPLNVVIQVVGSRGDVQPFVALGRVLKHKFGHRVRLATHPVFQEFVEENDLEFFNIGGDPAELMAFMVKNPGLMPGNDALKEGQIGMRRKAMFEIMQRTWRSCFEKGTGVPREAEPNDGFPVIPFVADAIIANPPSFGHIHCAERLGIPLHLMFTMPWSPTRSFPHPLSNITSTNAESDITNFLTYTLVELLTWQGLGDLINQFREITLGLPPLSVLSGPGINSRMKIPYTYCWSPALIPKPKDWAENIEVSGFYFLTSPDSFAPSNDLKQFLDSGPPPVYIGFGSIVVDDPNAMTDLIFEAVKNSGQRALVSKGWGGLGSNELSKPDGVFMLGNVPHDWLFKRVSCVVHHGGAGTTAAGIAAGKPTVIVPFFGDQPFWGAMIARAGAGPDPVPYKELTAEKLSASIRFALEPSTVRSAQAMADKIAAEDGAVAGALHFHKELSMHSLECSLLPGRKATWLVKGSEIRLSPLAASVLMQENKISVNQITIYRPRKFDTTQGPWEPFTGGASALLGTMGSLMGGVTDIPTDVFRHIGRLFKSKESSRGNESKDEANKTSDLEPLTLQSGLDAGRGAARIVTAGLKSPMDFTLALAKGFQNAPKLYGDKTVREVPEVTGISSGVKAATVGLGQGFYDGISGLLTQPAKGAREEGLEGLMKGFGKALGGIVLKPAAGIWGVPGYLSHGVWQELRSRINLRSDAEIIAGRIVEGEMALASADPQIRTVVLREWQLQNGSKASSKTPVEATSTKAAIRSKQQQDLVDHEVAAAVADNSRGNADEDALVAKAIEASLHDDLLRFDDDKQTAVSSTVPTHAPPSFTSSRDDLDTVPDTMSSVDDDTIDSDDDENMKKALQASRSD